MKNYEIMRDRWLCSEVVSDDFKQQIKKMSEEELSAMFSQLLSFGTAGLRAKMSAGLAAMNSITVAHATAALAQYILEANPDSASRGVAIAYDSRNNSREFAKRSAEVLTAMGIKVYIYPDLRPTPMLSFAVRYLNCAAGINITASHNPAEYNGYKAYGSDGAQLSPEAAAIVAKYMNKLDIFDDVPTPSQARVDLMTELGKEIHEAYINAVLKQRVNPSVSALPINIVYTPLYGCGSTVVPEVLKRAGYNGIYPVEEQMKPNGDFPGIKNPNPEFPEAFVKAIEVADGVSADLIIATDPDADRVGCMSRDKDGKFNCISGNQMGALLIDYIINAYNSTNTMPSAPYVVKSLVSTKLAEKICVTNNVRIFDVPTGFKFIGETIEKHLKSNDGTFIFGFEESYGYLKGNYARDKDAVVATLLIAEMAAYYKKLDKTLLDALADIYVKYGYYYERVFSISVDGYNANEKLEKMLSELRRAAPTEIAGVNIREVRDYKTSTITYADGKREPTGQPSLNMLYYVRDDDSTIIIRPSGTEPKVKVYIMANADNASACISALDSIEKAMRKILG